jgi:hypothetical protein
MAEIDQLRFKAVTKKQMRPLVGFAGTANHIVIQRNADGLICRLSMSTYAYVLMLTALFGPFLAAVMYFQPKWMNPAAHTPAIINGLVWCMTLLSSILFVRYLRGRPRIEVSCSARDIRYFNTWGSQPAFIVRQDEIRSLNVEEHFFLDEGTRVTNFFVSLTTREGVRKGLCVSTDEQLIRSLHRELEKLLDRRI